MSEPHRLAFWKSPNSRERFEEMLTLYLDGLTYTQIGQRFGLTRQRVQQVLREKATPDEYKLLRAAIEKREERTWLDTEIRAQLTEGYSCSKVAQNLGCSLSKVKRVSAAMKKSARVEVAPAT